MSKMLRRTLLVVAAGVLLYMVAVIYFGVDSIRSALVGYPWWVFVLALLLSMTNYVLRFLKWELALGWLRVRDEAPNLSLIRSFTIYIAGLSMSVTPGKAGEVLRSALLKASDDVPFTRTAPVVIADRLTDLVALVMLSMVGLAQYPQVWPVVVVTMVLVVVGVFVLGSPKILHACLEFASRLPLVGKVAHKLEPLIESTAIVLRLRGLVLLSGLSIVGWGLECVGYWVIINGFVGVDASLIACTFLWAAGTLVGALSFLPGGLGATEGVLLVASQQLLHGVTQPVAAAASLLARIATLWFAEILGGIALGLFLRNPILRDKAMHSAPDDTNVP